MNIVKKLERIADEMGKEAHGIPRIFLEMRMHLATAADLAKKVTDEDIAKFDDVPGGPGHSYQIETAMKQLNKFMKEWPKRSHEIFQKNRKRR